MKRRSHSKSHYAQKRKSHPEVAKSLKYMVGTE